MRLKILTFLQLIAISYSARILAVIPIPSFSHQVTYRKLFRELSMRGHQIVLLTTHPMHDPALTNLTEIDWHFAYDLYDRVHNMSAIIAMYETDFRSAILRYANMMHDIVDQELSMPAVKNLISSKTENFDLVMVEYYFPTMFAFSERFRCPFIGVTSMDAVLYGHQSLGNPTHPVLYPDIMLPFDKDLDFSERVTSTFYYLYMQYIKLAPIYMREDDTVRRHFGSGYPPLAEIERQVSMVFTNVNPVLDDGRPLSRAVVRIGGNMHIESPKSLPKDINDFINSAIEGVIYFSLGSNVKCAALGMYSLHYIIQAFNELPYKILWKCDNADMSINRSKIMIGSWFPQQDILRHSNLKLFITQGGLQSIEEAIYNEIPVLGLPFYFDQQSNIKKLVRMKTAIMLDYKVLSKNDFRNAIRNLTDNVMYRINMKILNVTVHDQPMSGLEKAVWWTEYVLRHKGALHLRNIAADTELYKYYFLDIIALVVFTLSLCTMLIKVVLLLITLRNRKFKQS